MKIKIWSQDNSDEENADEIEVPASGAPRTEDSAWSFWYGVERAVKAYAEKDYPRSDYWENAVFCVRVGEELKTYDVEVVMEPTFCVAERKLKLVPA